MRSEAFTDERGHKCLSLVLREASGVFLSRTSIEYPPKSGSGRAILRRQYVVRTARTVMVYTTKSVAYRAFYFYVRIAREEAARQVQVRA